MKTKLLGQISWPAGSMIICIDRQNSFNVEPHVIGGNPVASNTEANVTLTLKTPSVPGLYQSYFKLTTPEGKKFGQRLRCQIFVVSGTTSLNQFNLILPETNNSTL